MNKGVDSNPNHTAGIVGSRRNGTVVHNISPSSSSLTNSAGTSTDLASLFECPVCFDYVLPPIIQCQSGHLVCSNCRPKLSCCPTCRGPLGNVEKII